MAEESIRINRVFRHTDQESNERIVREIEKNISYYSKNTGKIDERLNELDGEWDIERMLETNAAGLGLFGLILGIAGNRCWLLLPLIVLGFLLQHAIQGWCPPVSILRRLGVRTTEEILRERNALLALRGDRSADADTPVEREQPKKRPAPRQGPVNPA